MPRFGRSKGKVEPPMVVADALDNTKIISVANTLMKAK
jgi:hypothetical protein